MQAPPYPLTVIEKVRLAPLHTLVKLDASGCPFGERHQSPGQYALMGWHRDSLAPLALASVPGLRPLEVLIGSATPEEERELLDDDGPLWASDPQGRGFPLERARGRQLLLFAGGAGVGAIRAVIEALLPRREAFGPVTLYYGVRRPELLCFQDRFQDWRTHGVDVVEVVSRDPSFAGARGYVQDALPAVIEGAADAIAFVCGRPEMEHDVTRALAARGVPETSVCRNWP
jgi:NAD(P)H-flavin reductase